jgi:hypothetical protein
LLVVVGFGLGGLELRLSPSPMEELDAVDVVSCALAIISLGSLGFEALVFESIPVARLCGERLNVRSVLSFFFILTLEGAYAVS